jgi:hypothetical protein
MAAAKKLKAKTKRLIIPIYEQALTVSNDLVSLTKYLKKTYKFELIAEDYAGCQGWLLPLNLSNGSVTWVLFAEDTQTLVHEAVHAAWHILNHVGVEIEFENHEVQAYLVDYIFHQTAKELSL